MVGRFARWFMDRLSIFAWFIWESPWKQLIWQIWDHPPILWIILAAGVSNIQLTFDTRIMVTVMSHLSKDFKSCEPTSIQTMIMTSSTIGAILGAAFGTWFSDRFGRIQSILAANWFFFIGLMVMISFQDSISIIIIGRLIFGFGIGLVSMVNPLFVSEYSAPDIRGPLTSLIFFVGVLGKYLSTWVGKTFSEFSGSWRWMLGFMALVLVLPQYFLIKSYEDTPIWSLRKERREITNEEKQKANLDAREALNLIYPKRMHRVAFALMNDPRVVRFNESFLDKLRNAFLDKRVSKVILLGTILQVATQISGLGLNAIIKYSSNILQYAGYHSGVVYTKLSGLQTWGIWIKIVITAILVDRIGKRRILIYCFGAIIVIQVFFSFVFYVSDTNGPKIGMFNNTCVALDCGTCIKNSCGFCTLPGKEFDMGVCLSEEGQCHDLKGLWFERGCPSYLGFYATILHFLLFVILLAFDLCLGTIPLGLTAEIYPDDYRGFGAGIATTTRWVVHLYLSLSSNVQATWSPSTTFLVNGFLSTVCLIPVHYWLAETNRVALQSVTLPS